MVKQIRLYVKGDVVGVGFRAWTKAQVKKYNITGWVKNIYNKPDIFGPNGGVEIVLQGEEGFLLKMISNTKEGSPISVVEDVAVYWEPISDLFEDFKVRV